MRGNLFSLDIIFFLFLFLLGGKAQFEVRDLQRTGGDPLYETAWNLHSTPLYQNGHMNVESAWFLGATGDGVTLGFAFQGPKDHQDLRSSLNQEGSANIGYEMKSSQKTSVIAAAVGEGYNQVCNRGVAYNAQYAVTQTGAEALTDYSFLENGKFADIFVIDFTGPNGPNVHFPCEKCWKRVENLFNQNRVVVGFSGNGNEEDNCNYDMYSNAPLRITVGAHEPGGEPSLFTETCASVLVSVPVGSNVGINVAYGSGVSCSERTGGQYAASQAAGVIALMLEANSTLTPREIAHILVDTADFLIPKFGQIQNGAGYYFDERIGFGNINAGKAVQMAAGLLPRKLIQNTRPHTRKINKQANINDHETIEIQIPMQADSVTRVDWVALKVDITHSSPGDLRITLTSPSGTTTTFVFPRINEGEEKPHLASLEPFGFSTTKNWMEGAQGGWVVRISDEASRDQGVLKSLEITLHTFTTPDYPYEVFPIPSPTPTPTMTIEPTPIPTLTPTPMPTLTPTPVPYSIGVDPEYPNAWNLHKTKEAHSAHLNVEPVWGRGVSGSGIVIGIGHHSPHFSHLEFQNRQSVYQMGDIDDSSVSQTTTAFLSAALGNSGNNVCSRGTAPSSSFLVIQTGSQAANGLNLLRNFHAQLADVVLLNIEGTDPDINNTFCETCWENAEMFVNQNKVLVSSSGSGGENWNCNYDLYSNSPHIITVSSHTFQNAPSSSSPICPSVLVSGPGGDDEKGIPVAFGETDDCSIQSGSRLASAQIAGVIGLMMEASPRKLTHREIAHILVESSTIIDAGQTKWNGAGFRHHPILGFGRVDADKAVKFAAGSRSWTHIVEEIVIKASSNPIQHIPSFGNISVSISPVNVPSTSLIDYVTVETQIEHRTAGDLRLTLISPSGTKSELASPHVIEQPNSLVKLGFMEFEKGRAFQFGLRLQNNGAERYPVNQEPLSPSFYVPPEGACCLKSTCTLNLFSFSSQSEIAILLLPEVGDCTSIVQITNIVEGAIVPDIIFVENVLYSQQMYNEVTATIPIFRISSRLYSSLTQKISNSPVNTFTLKNNYVKPDVSYENWKFSTVKYWGETVAGEWKMEISDEVWGDGGAVNSLSLSYHTYSYAVPPAPTPFSIQCCVFIQQYTHEKTCVPQMECLPLDDHLLVLSFPSNPDGCLSGCQS